MNREDRKRTTEATEDLRGRAEARLNQSGRSPHISNLSPADVEALVHELETHQVELEMQNEDLRKAHLALAEMHDRYLDLYDFAPVGYLTLDGTGKIVQTNLRGAELLGLPRSEVTGCVFRTLVSEDDQDALFLCMRNLQSEGKRHEVDLRLRRPDSRLLWARTEWTRTKGEGRLDCVRVTLSDITNTRELQARLALADRLANVGLLAASIGHEVNNPLTYVLYNLETMAEDLPRVIGRLADCNAASANGSTERLNPGAQFTKALANMEDIAGRAASALEGAHRIRDLVKGMRAFSRVDEELIEPVSFNAIVETALSMTAREISGRARIGKNLGEVPRVSANHGQMCQVFLNLLVNAAHAIEEGRVDDNEIAIRTWAEAGDVFAEVSDTGCGIPAENLDKIFDPFFTTKPVGSGTGLGLSICAKIVGALGGRLSVESEEGKGTRFTIRLPATTDEHNESVLLFVP